MLMRRALILGGILLVLFLAMYSWNRRTRVLDDMATNIGLEITSWILQPFRAIEDITGDIWNKYFDLVDVRDENLRLKARIEALEARLMATGEDLAELKRLRELVQFPVDVRWNPMAAKVLAGRIGPSGILNSITISRGYMNGAKPGIPVVTNLGLVGRILRSSPHASTALLITDPSSRISVYGQDSRASAIVKGSGSGKNLEVNFADRASGIKPGEILFTSGLDDKYPKGLPVAKVIAVAPSDYTQFMAIEAEPLVDLQHLEEILLLEKSGVSLPQEDEFETVREFVGPPLPPGFIRPKEAVSRHAKTDTVLQDSQSSGSSSPQQAPDETVPVNPANLNSPQASQSNSPAPRPSAPRHKVIIP